MFMMNSRLLLPCVPGAQVVSRPRLAMPALQRLTATAMLACGMASFAAAQDVSGVVVTPLHTFTGIGGSPVIGNTPEVAGQGANPNAPPVHDAASGRLIGVTQKGGNGSTTGVVFTLSLDASAQSFASINSADGSAASVNSPRLVPAEPGSYYLGLGGDVYRYTSVSAGAPSRTQIAVQPLVQAALTALGDASAAGGAGYGQWAYGSVGGLPSSLYLARIESGGTSAYTLWRYDTQADTVHRVHKWPGLGTISGGFLQAPGALPAALALDADGTWLYGVGNTTYPQQIEGSGDAVPLPFLFRVKPDGSDYRVMTTLGTRQDVGFLVSAGTVTHAFSGLLDGADGWLYGTTYGSQPAISTASVPPPPLDGLGSVYRVSKTAQDADGQHTLEVLHTFAGGDDGEGAAGALVKAADGNLYGTTRAGGAHGAGTLWRIVLADIGRVDGSNGYQQLHTFEAASVGKDPVGLSLGADGWTLYGAAYEGGTLPAGAPAGASASGTVFQVSLPQPVVTLDSFTVNGNPESAAIEEGQKVTLAWQSTNATVCAAGGDWLWSDPAKQASGQEESPALSHAEAGYVLTLQCRDGQGRESALGTVSVRVSKTLAPEPEPGDSGGSGGSGDDTGAGSDGSANEGGSTGGGGGGSGGGGSIPLLALLFAAGWRLRRLSVG